jgi:DNA-binding MarR family transcriptional regulator
MKQKRAGHRAGKSQVAPTHVMYSLMHAAQAVEKRMEQALERVELSGAKFAALSVLVQAGEPLSLGELATRLTCVRSNITQLVDRLEADGLVRRVDDPVDRRSKRAAVTPLGQKRQVDGARQVEQVQAEMARAMSGLDRDALESVLAALR